MEIVPMPKSFSPKEFFIYMLYDKKNNVYIESGNQKIWFSQSGAMSCARHRRVKLNLVIHKFKLVLSKEIDLTPTFILDEL